ncbi:hypothetical protein [Nitrospira sp. M1]
MRVNQNTGKWGWGLATGMVMLFSLSMIMIPSWALADDEPLPEKSWSAGGAIGYLANTPDGTAFALNLHVDANLNERVSVGPLLQLGFTGDLTQVGFSGQGKYTIPISETDNRLKVIFQAGIGFVHADPGPADTSFLIPLGVGMDYQINSQLAFTSDFLLNFTDLDHGRGYNDTNVMPSLTFGVRF